MPLSAGDHRDVVVTATLQLLGNICVEFRDGRDKVWRTFFPQTLGQVFPVFLLLLFLCVCKMNGEDQLSSGNSSSVPGAYCGLCQHRNKENRKRERKNQLLH